MKVVIKKHMRKGLLLFLPLFLTLLLRIFWNQNGFADWYAKTIFPIFPNTIGRLLSPIPFSVYEWILYTIISTGIVLVLLSLFFLIKKLYYLFIASRRKRGTLSFRQKKPYFPSKKLIFHIFYWIAVLSSFVLFLLHATDLINYRRSSVSKDFGLTVAPSSVSDLTDLCTQLAKEVNKLSKQIPVDEQGLLKLPSSYQEDAKQAMEGLGKQYKAFSGYYPNAKPVTFSRGMSHLNLTGLYSPFTLEANYNKDIPSYNIPYTICHEFAHLKGFIREDEAGFIAYMACINSSNVVLQYSGTLSAFIYATNALYETGDTETYQTIFSSLTEQVERDIVYNSYYWNQFRGKISDIAQSANDQYLKSNHQTDGVKSYGRMVDLMLAFYHAHSDAS